MEESECGVMSSRPEMSLGMVETGGSVRPGSTRCVREEEVSSDWYGVEGGWWVVVG